MACTLDTTVGGLTANSYGSIAEATAYFETRPNSTAWTAASTDLKCAALQTATRAMDVRVRYDGAPADFAQKLLWPRLGMINSRGDMLEGTVIPDEVKWAQFEIALGLLENDLLTNSSTTIEGVSRLKAGSVEIEFRQGATTRSSLVMTPLALDYLLPYIIPGTRGGNIKLARA